jgi:hypothetical protein
LAITAKFATYEGSPKKVYKTISSWSEEKTISAYEDIDDLTCDFILDGSGYHGYNYMRVVWGEVVKYYFIELRTGMRGNMTRLRGVCDVLTTYQGAVGSASAVINRTSDKDHGDPMLKDNKVTTRSVTELDSTLLASNIVSDTEYVYVGVLQKVPSVAATP